MSRRMSDIQKIKKGLGVVDLEHPELYKPWLHTREVCSGSGSRHILPDIIYPNRMIHLMSDLEKNVYYLLRRNKSVIELFEQVPLDLKITTDLCEELDITHPKEPYSNNRIVMTTDFLAYTDINGKKALKAFAVKTSSDLNNRRVLEKLLVEQKYWEKQNIYWSIITEKIFDSGEEVHYDRSIATERHNRI